MLKDACLFVLAFSNWEQVFWYGFANLYDKCVHTCAIVCVCYVFVHLSVCVYVCAASGELGTEAVGMCVCTVQLHNSCV